MLDGTPLDPGLIFNQSVLGQATTPSAVVSIVANNAVQSAGAAGTVTPFTFLVSIDQAPSGLQTVSWSVQGDGADPADAADFAGGVLPTGTLTFSPAQTSQALNVEVAGTNAFKPDEDFTVQLGNPSAGLTLGANRSASGEIVNANGDTINTLAYSWNNQALLPGVNTAMTGTGLGGGTSNPALTLQNVQVNSPNTLQADLWATAAPGTANFDFTVQVDSGESVQFAPQALPADWNVLQQTTANTTLKVAAIGLTPIGGPVDLGRLTWTLASGATRADVGLLSGDVGNTTASPFGLSYAITSSGGQGTSTLSLLAPDQYTVAASRVASDTGKAVTSADALAALKLAVGLNPNPLQASGTQMPVSPYQFIAADVTGDGRVTSADALAILRMAVQAPGAPRPTWEFVNEAENFWNPTTQSFTVDRSHVPTNFVTTIDTRQQTNIALVGVLTGDVNGSWSPTVGGAPITLPSLDVGDLFAVSAANGNSPLSQWNLSSASGVAVNLALADDTGISGSDSITSDPTIVGTIASGAQVVSLTAGFGTDATTYTNVIGALASNGSVRLGSSQLAQLSGATAANGVLADGTYTLHLLARDSTGAQSSAMLTVTLDTAPPTVTTVSPSTATSSVVVPVDVLFSKPVAPLSTSSLELSGPAAVGATVTSVQNVSGKLWRFEVAGLAPGQVTATLGGAQGASIADIAGTALAPQSWTFTVDRTAPTVVSITPDDTVVDATTTTVVLTFSKQISNVQARDLVLTGAGAASAQVGTPTGASGNAWQFPVTGLQPGNVSVQFAPFQGDAIDVAGNQAATANDMLSIDATPPTLVSFSPTSGSVVTSTTAYFTLVFDKPVQGLTNNTLVLGGASASATVVLASSNTGPSTSWTYSVSGLVDGSSTATVAPVVGSVTDPVGNPLATRTWGFTVAATVLPTDGVVLTMHGAAANAQAGYTIAGIGDFNGDGLSDLLVTTGPGLETTGGENSPDSPVTPPVYYIVVGSKTPKTVELSTLVADGNGVEIDGLGSDPGIAAGAGDFNGDGLADVIIGTPGNNEAFIVFGTRTAQKIALSGIVARGQGAVIEGASPDDQFGTLVAGIGDFNGDGYSDVAIYAPNVTQSGTSDTGDIYVIFGKSDAQTISVGSLVASGGGDEIVGAYNAVVLSDGLDYYNYFSNGLAAVGDFNGDGLTDLAIGPLADADTAYIVYGSRTAQVYTLSTLVSSGHGSTIAGTDGQIESIAGAGDFNGDGYSDVVIGSQAFGHTSGIFGGSSYYESGTVRIIYGAAGARSISLSAGTEVTSAEYNYVPNYGYYFLGNATLGSNVAGLGDINGDGLSDIAFSVSFNGVSQVDVLYGTKSPASFYEMINLENGSIGRVIDANSALIVSGAGDTNGDGLDDILLGSSTAAPNGPESGAAFVAYGRQSSTVTSRSFSAFVPAGVTPAIGIGDMGAPFSGTEPDSQVWLQFSDTSATAPALVQVTDYTTLTASGVAGLDGTEIVGDVRQIATQRTGINGTQITLRYTTDELTKAGLSEGDLRILWSPDGKTWAVLGTAVGTWPDSLTATVSELGFFAIGIPAAIGQPGATLASDGGPIFNSNSFLHAVTVQYSGGASQIQASTFGGQDLVVTGPDGSALPVSLSTAAPPGNSGTIQATYEVAAPSPLQRTGGFQTQANTTPSLSADGRYVAYLANKTDTSGNWQITVEDLQGGTISYAGLSGMNTQPALSQNGDFLAFVNQSFTSGSRQDVIVENLASKTTKNVTALANAGASSPALSADGQYVAFVSQATNLAPGVSSHSNVYIEDLTTGVVTLVSAGLPGDSTAPSLSSNGRQVAFLNTTFDGSSQGPYRLYVMDLDSGKLQLIASSAYSFKGFQISQDGMDIVFGATAAGLVSGDAANQDNVYLENISSHAITLVNTTSGGAYPAIAGDDNTIVFAESNNGGTNSDLYLRNIATNTVIQLTRAGVNGIFAGSEIFGNYDVALSTNLATVAYLAINLPALRYADGLLAPSVGVLHGFPEGSYTVSLAANQVQTTVGVPIPAAPLGHFTSDLTKPTVVSVTSDAYTPSTTIDVVVTFSKQVKGVTAGDLLLNGAAVQSGTVTGVYDAGVNAQGQDLWHFELAGLVNGTATVTFQSSDTQVTDVLGLAQVSLTTNPSASFTVDTGLVVTFAQLEAAAKGQSVLAGDPSIDIGSVTGIGDFNGDGIGDYVVSAPAITVNGRSDAGSMFIVFGSRDPNETVDLATLVQDGKGIRIDGAAGSDLGDSVAAAGDFNGDGLDDVVISATTGGIGRAYVIFGTARGQEIDLSTTDLVTSGLGDEFLDPELTPVNTVNVAGIGDFNGDGRSDIAISMPYVNFTSGSTTYGGLVWVVYGFSGSRTLDLNTLTSGSSTSGLFLYGSQPGGEFGAAITGAGDFNGTGYSDLLIGSPMATQSNGMTNAGRAYIVFGRPGTVNSPIALNGSATTENLTGVGVAFYGAAAGDHFGASVAALGDTNGDGFDDVAIGAPDASPLDRFGAGAAYVIFGSTSPKTFNVSTIQTTAGLGVELDGAVDGEAAGSLVGSEGDLIGDGSPSVAIVAPDTAIYLVDSAALRVSQSIDLARLVASGKGRTIVAGTGSFDISAVHAAGDVNGDGALDLLAVDQSANTLHIVYGTPSPPAFIERAWFPSATVGAAPGLTRAVGALGDDSTDGTPPAWVQINYTNAANVPSDVWFARAVATPTTFPTPSFNASMTLGIEWDVEPLASSVGVSSNAWPVPDLTFSFPDQLAAGFDKSQLRILFYEPGMSAWTVLPTDTSLLSSDELKFDGGTLPAWGQYSLGGFFLIGLPSAIGLPAAVLTPPPTVTTLGGTTQQFTVTYSDAQTTINAATLGKSEIVVNGPNGFSTVPKLVSVSPTGNAATVTAVYQFMPPGGSWTSSDSGTYTFVMQPAAVAGSNGATVTPGPLGALIANLPVVFADQSVQAAVLLALGLSAGTTLHASDLAPLTSLTLDSDVVTSLSGLQIATNLATLTIEPSVWGATVPGIADLTLLQQMPSLTNLTLQGLGLGNASLSTLSQAAGLRTLDLRYNAISGLTGQSWLGRLTTLDLYGNSVTDLSPLQGALVAVDIAPTAASQATSIAGLAAALNDSPLAMYQWVYNNVAYDLSSGLMKGALATLQTRSGNAWDQANLLTSLLAQTGIQTHLVTGRVDLYSMAALTPWIGIEDPQNAGTLLYYAGLEPQSDGTISHAWVEALLPNGNGGQSWVAMDPSYKATAFQPGLSGLMQAVPFDLTGYLAQTSPLTAVQWWEDQIKAYLAVNDPVLSIADVGFQGGIVQRDFSALPALPYTVASVTGRYSATDTTDPIPISIEDTATVTLTWTDPTNSANTLLALHYTFVLPTMSLQPIAIAWVAPLGQASIVAADGSLQGTPTSVVPQLLLNGVPVQTGAAVPWRWTVNVTVQLAGPGVQYPDGSGTPGTYTVQRQAGQYLTIGINAGQTSTAEEASLMSQVLAANAAARDGATFNMSAQVGAVQELAFVQYTDEFNEALNEIDSVAHLARADFVSYAILTSEEYGSYNWALDIPFVPNGALIDYRTQSVYGVQLSVSADPGDVAYDAAAVVEGWEGSSLEATIWENLLNQQTISTVTALQMANQNGTPVFTIDEANASLYLPQLTLAARDVANIATGVAHGATVIVPRDPIKIGSWTGTGYYLDHGDFQGYEAGYLVDGQFTAHGGDTVGPESVPQAPPKDSSDQTGDPVDFGSGDFTHDETDISLPGIGIGLTFARHYDSQSSVDVGMGAGWVFTYSDYLTISSGDPSLANGTVTWHTDQGYSLVFTPNGSGGYNDPARYYGTLSKNSSGYNYRETDGFTYGFDLFGRLLSETDRNGNQVLLGYTVPFGGAPYLSTVTESANGGEKLTLSWSISNLSRHITQISDGNGRTWTYSYNTQGELIEVTAPTNANTAASTTQYTYYTDAAYTGMIQSIVAPNGGTTTVEYYTNARVFRVTDPTGASQSFYYGLYEQVTSFVDERGDTTTYFYNAAGQTTRQESPDHTTETFVYTDGLLSKQTDEVGGVQTYVYDSRGSITRQVDATGIETDTTYDPIYDQVLSSLRKNDGQLTTFSYDAHGNLVTEIDALGDTTTMTYDSHGQLLTRTQPDGVATAAVGDYTTTYTYNALGEVLTQTTDLPATIVNTYDALGRLISTTDANGNTTKYTYDLLNRVLTVTDALGRVTTNHYDTMGDIVSTTDAKGQTTTYTYDLKQRLTTVVAADGTRRTLVYDAAGNTIASIDALGRVTTYQYDSRNRLVATMAPDGSRQTSAYDGDGRVVSRTDALGNTTRTTYDLSGRVLTVVDALGDTVTYSYDDVGRLVATTDLRGGVTHYTYDALGRLIRTDEPGGLTIVYAYDADGNTISETDYDVSGLSAIPSNLSALPASRQRTTTYFYDVENRLVRTVDPVGATSTTQYDLGGRIVRTVDALGVVTTYAYDAAGNLLSQTASDGGVTRYSYDALNRQISLTMPDGGLWLNGYDMLGHTITQTDPTGAVTRYSHDAAGETTGQFNPDGSDVLTSYDSLGRPIQVQRSVGTTDRYTYDANGNLLTASNANGTDSFVYDELNRPILETQSLTDGFTVQLEYSYDAAGDLKTEYQFAPWSRTITYRYDIAGRLTGASSTDGGSATISYDGFGDRVGLSLGAGVTERMAYDADGRVVSIAYDTGGTTSGIAYARDSAGLPTQIQENLNGVMATLNLTLDGIGRVTAVAGPAGRGETFAYDLDGNLVVTGGAGSLTVNSADEVAKTAAGNTDISNAQGDQTVSWAADGSRTVMTYDASNRMISASQYDASGALVGTTTYLYDALGRRVASIEGQLTTYQVMAGQVLTGIETRQGSTLHQTEYLAGTALDDVFAALVDGQARYLLLDAIGSVRIVTSASGTVLATASYSQFGELQASTGTNDTGLGYVARPTDVGTELVDMRARMYDPTLGRFYGRDPVSSLGLGLSLYQYAKDQPLVFTDPTGRTVQEGAGRTDADDSQSQQSPGDDLAAYTAKLTVKGTTGMSVTTSPESVGYKALGAAAFGVGSGIYQGYQTYQAFSSSGGLVSSEGVIVQLPIGSASSEAASIAFQQGSWAATEAVVTGVATAVTRGVASYVAFNVGYAIGNYLDLDNRLPDIGTAAYNFMENQSRGSPLALVNALDTVGGVINKPVQGAISSAISIIKWVGGKGN